MKPRTFVRDRETDKIKAGYERAGKLQEFLSHDPIIETTSADGVTRDSYYCRVCGKLMGFECFDEDTKMRGYHQGKGDVVLLGFCKGVYP